MDWSGEPTIVMRAIDKAGVEFRHNFYVTKLNPWAVDAAQFYEYILGCVVWLEYHCA